MEHVIFFFSPCNFLLKNSKKRKSEAARCCQWKCQLLFPGVDNTAAKCPQFSFSWTRIEKDLQFLVSRGAFQSYNPKFPGSCRQLHSTCPGVIGRRRMSQKQICQTSAGRTPVKRNYRACWFSSYTLECALGPPVLAEYPSLFSLCVKPNPRFQMRGILQCLQGKGIRTFLLCEKQCIFN